MSSLFTFYPHNAHQYKVSLRVWDPGEEKGENRHYTFAPIMYYFNHFLPEK
jgi:hypothetical protein